MAAAMETCRTIDADAFTLNYREVTTVSFFRLGYDEEPIPHRLRCLSCAEWQMRETRIYSDQNRVGRRENLRPIDFILDDNGQILPERSSGFSTYNSIRIMAQKLNVNPRRLWEMPKGTPFPSEMNIFLNPNTGHASIKPASRVSPERFAKMLNCLHWVKVPSQNITS